MASRPGVVSVPPDGGGCLHCTLSDGWWPALCAEPSLLAAAPPRRWAYEVLVLFAGLLPSPELSVAAMGGEMEPEMEPAFSGAYACRRRATLAGRGSCPPPAPVSAPGWTSEHVPGLVSAWLGL